MLRAALFIFVLLVVAVYAEAGYRKPPFNGSIFGKRSVAMAGDYDVANRALTAMCEVASETCTAWYNRQDMN